MFSVFENPKSERKSRMTSFIKTERTTPKKQPYEGEITTLSTRPMDNHVENDTIMDENMFSSSLIPENIKDDLE